MYRLRGDDVATVSAASDEDDVVRTEEGGQKTRSYAEKAMDVIVPRACQTLMDGNRKSCAGKCQFKLHAFWGQCGDPQPDHLPENKTPNFKSQTQTHPPNCPPLPLLVTSAAASPCPESAR